MVTLCVSQEQVAILLDPDEGQPPLALISACLRAKGLQPWASMEAELYPGKGCDLLFARPLPPLRSRLGPGSPRLRRPASMR